MPAKGEKWNRFYKYCAMCCNTETKKYTEQLNWPKKCEICGKQTTLLELKYILGYLRCKECLIKLWD